MVLAISITAGWHKPKSAKPSYLTAQIQIHRFFFNDMKLFTRSLAALLLLAASLAPSLAADITIQVGNNYYRGPGTTGNADIRTITVGDRVIFVWVAGFHPTQSDSAPQAWPTFIPSQSQSSTIIPFNSVGVFPYHCTAHGAPGVGQYGVLTVVARNPSATLNVEEAGISVNVFPNPSRGQVIVKLDRKLGSGDYKLRLSNIIGQEVRSIALRPALTEAGLPLDLRDLPAGMYLCSLVADGKVLGTKRLILQN